MSGGKLMPGDFNVYLHELRNIHMDDGIFKKIFFLDERRQWRILISLN
jgi:hypothetical protein